jgi:hypothetical protein
MIGPDDYKSIARLLREEAAQPSTSWKRSVRAIGLAKHFEVLATDPSAEFPMERYG